MLRAKLKMAELLFGRGSLKTLRTYDPSRCICDLSMNERRRHESLELFYFIKEVDEVEWQNYITRSPSPYHVASRK